VTVFAEWRLSSRRYLYALLAVLMSLSPFLPQTVADLRHRHTPIEPHIQGWAWQPYRSGQEPEVPRDIDRFSPDFVEKSVAVDEMFANMRGAGFRHRSAHHGLRSKKFRRENNLFDNAAGMLGGHG